MNGIERAIRSAQGVSQLARHLGVSRQRVQNWRAQGYVPLDRVVEIEAEFGVDRRSLMRPDLVDVTAGVME